VRVCTLLDLLSHPEPAPQCESPKAKGQWAEGQAIPHPRSPPDVSVEFKKW